MKIHYQRYRQLLLTFFLVWLFLAVAKILAFDFSLNMSLFFAIFCIFLAPFLFLEMKANQNFLKEYFSRQLLAEKNRYNRKVEEIEGKIISFSRLFSGKSGRFLARRIALVFVSLLEITKVLQKTVFSRYIILALCIFGITFEIFVITSTIDSVVLILTGAWILTVKLFKFSGKISIGAALFLLILMFFLLVFKKDFLAGKASVWAYLFLLVGTLQLAKEPALCSS